MGLDGGLDVGRVSDTAVRLRDDDPPLFVAAWQAVFGKHVAAEASTPPATPAAKRTRKPRPQ